jgi:hypothetical protein
MLVRPTQRREARALRRESARRHRRHPDERYGRRDDAGLRCGASAPPHERSSRPGPAFMSGRASPRSRPRSSYARKGGLSSPPDAPHYSAPLEQHAQPPRVHGPSPRSGDCRSATRHVERSRIGREAAVDSAADLAAAVGRAPADPGPWSQGSVTKVCARRARSPGSGSSRVGRHCAHPAKATTRRSVNLERPTSCSNVREAP